MTFADTIIFAVPMFFGGIVSAYFFRSQRFSSKPMLLRTTLSGILAFILSFIWGGVLLKVLTLGTYIINDFTSVIVLALLHGLIGALLFYSFFPKRSNP